MKKFERIYLDIEGKIQRGIYIKDSILPSENQLAEDFHVSRETIRKALSMLEDNGYIHKKQGLGSIILDYKRFSLPISGLTSYKELQEQQHLNAETQVIVNEVIPVPDFLKKELELDPDEEFIHLIRLRKIDDEGLIVDEDYIRKSIVDSIPNEKAVDSIYAYFEEDLGLNIAFASKEIMASKVEEQFCKLLHIQPTDYVINVKSNVYLEDTRFFQHTISHHKLDKFRFFDFARRKQIFNDK